MMEYRFNVRFDLDDERDRRAAEYLSALKRGSRNRFIIDAILAQTENGADVATLDGIRRIIRDEFQRMPLIAPSASETGQAPITEEEQAENDRSVLSDLEDFFG